MTKTIMILAITAAFVAGSIATGTLAFAGGDDDDNLIIDALNNIAAAISGIEPNVTVDTPITVEVPADSIQVDVVGLQGPDGEQGPDGDKGETGDKGPTGDAGPASISGYERVNNSEVGFTLQTSGTDQFHSVIATCSAGKRVVGGGYSLLGSSSFFDDVKVASNIALSNSEWGTNIMNQGTSPITVGLQVFAVCVN